MPEVKSPLERRKDILNARDEQLKKFFYCSQNDSVNNPDEIETQRVKAKWNLVARAKKDYRRVQKSVYKRQNIEFRNSSSLSKLRIITKNDRFNRIVWFANPDKIKLLKRYGFGNHQSLLAGASEKLGLYRQIVLGRALDAQIVSNNHTAKIAILNFAQDALELLEPIERVLLSQDESDVETKINALNIDQSEFLKAFGKIKIEKNKNLTAQDRKLLKQCQKDVLSAFRAIKDYAGKPDFKYKLAEALRKSTKIILETAQGLNQSLVHRNAFLRGDLRNAIVDAVKYADDYVFDYNNSITAEHQGYFAQSAQKDRSNHVALDTHLMGVQDGEIKRFLLVVHQIEGGDGALFEDQNMVEAKQGKLTETSKTKWAAAGSKGVVTRKVLAFLPKLLCSIVLGLTVDLVLGLVESAAKGLGHPFRAISFVDLAHRGISWLLRIRLKDTLPKNNITEKFYETLKSAKIAHPSIGNKIGKGIAWVFSSLIVAPIVQIPPMVKRVFLDKNFKPQIPLGFKVDYYSAKKIEEIDGILAKLIPSVPSSQSVQPTQPTQGATETKGEAVPLTPIALPSENLAPWKPNDMLNIFATGSNAFADFFEHEIYAKHPFVGFLFSAVYLAGGATVAMPLATVHHLGAASTHYAKFSKGLAHLLSKSKKGEIIGSGFLQGKLTAGLAELAMHGPRSWIVKGLDGLLEDPASRLIILAVAVGAGWCMGHNLPHVPFISKEVGKDAGVIWEPSAAVASAKLSLVLMHLLFAEHEGNIRSVERQEKVERFLIQGLLRGENPTQKAEKDKIKGLAQAIVSGDKQQVIECFGNALTVGQAGAADSAAAAVVGSVPKLNDLGEDVMRDQQILAYQDQLKNLSTTDQAQLIAYYRQKGEEDKAQAIWRACRGKEHLGPIARTLRSVFAHIGFVFRAVAALPVGLATLSLKPLGSALYGWGRQFFGDFVRVIHFLTQMSKVSKNGTATFINTVSDVIVNSVVARAESQLTDQSSVSKLYARGRIKTSTRYDECTAVLNALVHLDSKYKWMAEEESHKINPKIFGNNISKCATAFRDSSQSSQNGLVGQSAAVPVSPAASAS